MENKRYGIEVLHWAGMKDEFLPQLQQLILEQPELLHYQNKYGENALHIATRVNNIEIFKWLINNTDIDYKVVTDKGNVLLLAIECHCLQIAQYVLQHTDIDYKVVTAEEKNIFHLLLRRSNDTLLEQLIQKYPEGINHLDKNNENCLFDFISYFSQHKKYYLFNIIQDIMHPDVFKTVNNKQQNLLDFTLSIIDNSTTNIERSLKEEMLSPLINQLEFYLQ